MLSQYLQHPYPQIPLLARLRAKDLHALNFAAMYSLVHGSLKACPERPRILILGCGTFEPCAVAKANPVADIVAIDFSEASLRRLSWHLRMHGLSRRVETHCMDLMDISSAMGTFDLVIATGVLHHLSAPELAVKRIADILTRRGLMRAMIYSAFGREWIYSIQAMVKGMGISSPRELRQVISRLPNNHPLFVHFHMYQDNQSDAGCVDGFLHARDKGFTPNELGKMLDRAGLYARHFFMPEGSRPKDFQAIFDRIPLTEQLRFRQLSLVSDWEKLQVMDALGEVESNFKFIASKSSSAMNNSKKSSLLKLNPYLETNRLNSVYSEIFRREINLTRVREIIRAPKEEIELVSALGSTELDLLIDAGILIRA